MHYKVLDLLYKYPKITQRELARKTGVSLGSLHYCLKSFVEKGWLKAESFKKNPRKYAYLYLLTPAGILQKTKLAYDFLRRKKKEYDDLRDVVEQLSKELHGKS
jgi:MarR family transcriptional regulator, temperature-dependent positive regulator of motility